MNSRHPFRDHTGENRSLGSDVAVSLDPNTALNADLDLRARVLVVDDHAFLRTGLVKLINRQQNLVCCGEADSIASALLIVMEQKPHLVLLDMQLKDGEAFELIDQIKAKAPRISMLVLSQGDEGIYAEKVLRAGAKGYIMKQEAAAELITAIGEVLLGKIYVSPVMAGRLPPELYPGKGLS